MFERLVVVLGVKRRLQQVADASDNVDELAFILRKQRKWDQPEPPRSVTRAWDVETIDLDGFAVHLGVSPSGPQRRVILYLHGGGYMFGPFRAEWPMLTKLAAATACDFALLNYPKAPEYQVEVTQSVVQQVLALLAHRYGAASVVLVGASAGGGLAVSAMVALREAGQRQPACAVLISPAVDMTMSDDVSALEDDDVLLSIDFIRSAGEAYAQPLQPADARVSPMFADLKELSPLLVLVGDHEILLPSVRRLTASARTSGTTVDLYVGHGQQHAWPHAPTPEADDAIERMAAFVSTSPLTES
jgi:acetyl esterase/lipase